MYKKVWVILTPRSPAQMVNRTRKAKYLGKYFITKNLFSMILIFQYVTVNGVRLHYVESGDVTKE